MSSQDDVNMVVETLQDLIGDDSIPRNVRNKLQEMIDVLKSDEALAIRINKVLSALDEISDDTNLQAYTRTQVWGLASMLESIETD